MTYKFITKINPSDGSYSNDPNGIISKSDKAWIPNDPANTDNQEYLKWVNEGNKAEEPSVEDDWEQVRGRRDGLLAGSDWTMTTGATIDQAQWSAYREKLRDIPQTYKNVSHPLTEVVWPTTPSSKGPNS